MFLRRAIHPHAVNASISASTAIGVKTAICLAPTMVGLSFHTPTAISAQWPDLGDSDGDMEMLEYVRQDKTREKSSCCGMRKEAIAVTRTWRD